MTRRPLSELNITDFITTPSTTRSKKRPSNTSLLSPSKRRVLESEGIPYLSPNPRSLLHTLSKSNFLSRKLDFGPPKSSNTPLPNQQQPASPLAKPCSITTATTGGCIDTDSRSPHVSSTSATSSTSYANPEVDNPFATPRSAKPGLAPSPDITPQPAKRAPKRDTVFEDMTGRNSVLWHSPRKRVSAGYYYYVDRQSEHYPGFDVYYDPTDKERPPTHGIEGEREDGGAAEGSKENGEPGRKSEKAVSVSGGEREVGEGTSTPAAAETKEER